MNVRIESSPVYLDSSALARIYVSEPESDALEAALVGRRDLIVSDLVVTELTSAVARRVRDGQLRPADARRLYRRMLRDVEAGEFQRAEVSAAIHREAERLLLVLGARLVLRAADALHLALASIAGARVLVTFDRRMAAAAAAVGAFELPATEEP